MAEHFYTILTNIGKAKIANATALGGKVNFQTLVLGDGNGSYYDPTEEQTTLRKEVWRGPINHVTIDEDNPNWIKLSTVVPANVGGFTVREIGAVDDEGDLLLVGKYPETYKPVAADGSTKDLVVNMIMEVSNTSSITLKVDPNVIVATLKDLQELAGEGRTTETVKGNADAIKQLENTIINFSPNDEFAREEIIDIKLQLEELNILHFLKDSKIGYYDLFRDDEDINKTDSTAVVNVGSNLAIFDDNDTLIYKPRAFESFKNVTLRLNSQHYNSIQVSANTPNTNLIRTRYTDRNLEVNDELYLDGDKFVISDLTGDFTEVDIVKSNPMGTNLSKLNKRHAMVRTTQSIYNYLYGHAQGTNLYFYKSFNGQAWNQAGTISMPNTSSSNMYALTVKGELAIVCHHSMSGAVQSISLKGFLANDTPVNEDAISTFAFNRTILNASAGQGYTRNPNIFLCWDDVDLRRLHITFSASSNADARREVYHYSVKVASNNTLDLSTETLTKITPRTEISGFDFVSQGITVKNSKPYILVSQYDSRITTNRLFVTSPDIITHDITIPSFDGTPLPLAWGSKIIDVNYATGDSEMYSDIVYSSIKDEFWISYKRRMSITSYQLITKCFKGDLNSKEFSNTSLPISGDLIESVILNNNVRGEVFTTYRLRLRDSPVSSGVFYISHHSKSLEPVTIFDFGQSLQVDMSVLDDTRLYFTSPPAILSTQTTDQNFLKGKWQTSINYNITLDKPITVASNDKLYSRDYEVFINDQPMTFTERIGDNYFFDIKDLNDTNLTLKINGKNTALSNVAYSIS